MCASASAPSPTNSTNAPTGASRRSSSVTASATSAATTPGGGRPVSRTPTHEGFGTTSGLPRSTVSASMPPTPQPITPMPLTIGVCESVPMTSSAPAVGSSKRGSSATGLASRSTWIWWMIPVPGGTMRMPSNACCAHLRNR